MLNLERLDFMDAKSRKLIDEILKLKKEKNAVILAHSYQRPEIYEVADFIGDSYDLSKKAMETKASMIVFCGVKFMAEFAKILNPEKAVLLPEMNAGCSMANMASADAVREMKKKHPDAGVVSYVNSTAEVKAESDACCTSANCLKVVEALPEKKIIFVPDENMGRWIQSKTKKKKIILWNGYCINHSKIDAKQLEKAKKKHPSAKTLIHPESKMEVIALADAVLGTQAMIDYVAKSDADEFIIGTETGMMNRLEREFPEKKFFAAPCVGTCVFMKLTKLESVRDALLKMQHRIEISEGTRLKAKKALDKMLEIGK